MFKVRNLFKFSIETSSDEVNTVSPYYKGQTTGFLGNALFYINYFDFQVVISRHDLQNGSDIFVNIYPDETSSHLRYKLDLDNYQFSSSSNIQISLNRNLLVMFYTDQQKNQFILVLDVTPERQIWQREICRHQILIEEASNPIQNLFIKSISWVSGDNKMYIYYQYMDQDSFKKFTLVCSLRKNEVFVRTDNNSVGNQDSKIYKIEQEVTIGAPGDTPLKKTVQGQIVVIQRFSKFDYNGAPEKKINLYESSDNFKVYLSRLVSLKGFLGDFRVKQASNSKQLYFPKHGLEQMPISEGSFDKNINNFFKKLKVQPYDVKTLQSVAIFLCRTEDGQYSFYKYSVVFPRMGEDILDSVENSINDDPLVSPVLIFEIPYKPLDWMLTENKLSDGSYEFDMKFVYIKTQPVGYSQDLVLFTWKQPATKEEWTPHYSLETISSTSNFRNCELKVKLYPMETVKNYISKSNPLISAAVEIHVNFLDGSSEVFLFWIQRSSKVNKGQNIYDSMKPIVPKGRMSSKLVKNRIVSCDSDYQIEISSSAQEEPSGNMKMTRFCHYQGENRVEMSSFSLPFTGNPSTGIEEVEFTVKWLNMYSESKDLLNLDLSHESSELKILSSKNTKIGDREFQLLLSTQLPFNYIYKVVQCGSGITLAFQKKLQNLPEGIFEQAVMIKEKFILINWKLVEKLSSHAHSAVNEFQTLHLYNIDPESSLHLPISSKAYSNFKTLTFSKLPTSSFQRTPKLLSVSIDAQHQVKLTSITIDLLGDSLSIPVKLKTSLNKYKDKLVLEHLDVPRNKIQKDVEIKIGDLLEIPNLNPGLVFWLKIFVVIGFLVAILILALVIVRRKIDKDGLGKNRVEDDLQSPSEFLTNTLMDEGISRSMSDRSD